MTTLRTADGRLLRAQAPSGSGLGSSGLFPSSFAPMWSDGERMPNAATDGLDGWLVSYEKIYRSQPVLAGVIDLIAYRASTLPFGAFTVDRNEARTAIPRSDSLASLLRRPRPRASTVHLLNFIFTSLLVHGNALVAQARTTGEPDGLPDMLWPLDWSQISAYGEVGGDVELWGTTQLGGEELFLDVDKTLHFAWPAPSGGQIGVSPLEKLGVTIKIEDAGQRYQTANFRNGGRGQHVISFEKDLKDDQLQRVRAALKAFHGGVDQAGNSLLLSANAKAYTLAMSAVEVALIDQRRLNREEVAIVLGLSGPSLTDSTNSALGNVAERFRAFYRDVLPPWTTLAVETFEAQLLDPQPAWMDRVVRFDFSDKLRGEPRENAEKLKMEVEAGLRSRNEGRKEIGLPPEGDPDDPENPANKLTANVNNQAPVDEMGAASTAAPASQE